MRKIISLGYSVCLCIFLLVYILSCLTSVISPLDFSPMGLLGLGFPYLFVLTIILTVYYYIRKRRFKWWMTAFCLLGSYNFFHVYAFHPTPWKMEKDSSTIRILTWNAEGFDSKIIDHAVAGNAYLALIDKYKPDILCLQEYSTGMMVDSVKRESLKMLDSMGYFGAKLTLDSREWNGYPVDLTTGVSIFCKKYILIQKSTEISKDPRQQQGYATADIVLHGKALRINSGRLSSYGLYSDTNQYNKSIYEITFERKRNIQHQLRRNEQVHEQQVNIIRKNLDYSPLPIIYCGDMNAVPTSYNYFLLRGKDLQDAFLKGGWGIGATFYNIVPTLRIDLCLVSKQFKVLQSKVITDKISDHYPLITDVKWKD